MRAVNGSVGTTRRAHPTIKKRNTEERQGLRRDGERERERERDKHDVISPNNEDIAPIVLPEDSAEDKRITFFLGVLTRGTNEN